MVTEENNVANQLKKWVREKKYEKAIVEIRKQIIKLVVKDIQKKEPDYEFTTIFDLIQTCDTYQYKFKNTIRNIYNIDEYYDLDEISELLEVYEKLLKSARSE